MVGSARTAVLLSISCSPSNSILYFALKLEKIS